MFGSPPTARLTAAACGWNGEGQCAEVFLMDNHYLHWETLINLGYPGQPWATVCGAIHNRATKTLLAGDP